MDTPQDDSPNPGLPPFQWDGRDLNHPPELLGSSRRHIPNVLPDLKSVASYYINGRYTKQATKLNPKNLSLKATIDYRSKISQLRTPLGYTVTAGPDLAPFNLQPCDPSRWEPHWMKIMDAEFQEEAVNDEEGSMVLELYTSDQDQHQSYFVLDETQVFSLRLKTAASAFQLYMGLYSGSHDMVLCPTLVMTSNKLHHWATIRDKVRHRVRTEGSGTDVMVQYRQVESNADLDETVYGVSDLTSSFKDRRLLWTRSASDTVPTDCFLQDGESTQHELFLGTDERESSVYYLYNVTAHEWYTVWDCQKSMVSHVRGDISGTEFTDSKARGHWDSVRTNFDLSLHPVQLFVCTDENKTLLDRVIVKPTFRYHGSNSNDNTGQSIEPRELFLNKIINQYGESEKKAFTRMLHSSYHYSQATYYMYFEYLRFGSLSMLMERCKENARRQNGTSQIPEFFIWIVFERIVNACHDLRHNILSKNGQTGFVHGDIKPQNVLLTGSSGADAKAHPEIVLSDFELYYRLGREDITGSQGTPGFIAPEVAGGPYPHTPIRTDVWQIGCLIYSMMRNVEDSGIDLVVNPAVPHVLDVEYSTSLIDAETKYDALYSADLTKIVEQCLHGDLRYRPDLSTLLQLVSDGAAAYNEQNGNPRDMKYDELPEWFKVDYMHEEFMKGSTFEGRKQRGAYGKYSDEGFNPYSQGEAENFRHHVVEVSSEEEEEEEDDDHNNDDDEEYEDDRGEGGVGEDAGVGEKGKGRRDVGTPQDRPAEATARIGNEGYGGERQSSKRKSDEARSSHSSRASKKSRRSQDEEPVVPSKKGEQSARRKAVEARSRSLSSRGPTTGEKQEQRGGNLHESDGTRGKIRCRGMLANGRMCKRKRNRGEGVPSPWFCCEAHKTGWEGRNERG